MTPSDIAICTPAEIHQRINNFQSIPWFRFQTQLEIDATFAVGNVSDTWTPEISINTYSVYAAYTFLKAYSWDVLDYRAKCGRFPIVPTIPSMRAMLTSDVDSDETSHGQEVAALSSLSTGFELVQAVLYLSTNNLGDESFGRFVKRVTDSSRRWVLKSIFSYKTPTTEVLADNLLLGACAIDDIDLVLFLLGVGADANVRTHFESALLNAIQYGSVRLVRLLIEGGAEINPNLEGYHSRKTPLQMALSKAKPVEMVQLLLERGADVNTYGSWDSTPHLCSAVMLGCRKTVQMLLNAGASIDRWDKIHGTALQVAAKYDNVEIFHVLLANGCHVEAHLDSFTDRHTCNVMDGYYAYISPLVHATRNENVSMVKALLEAGANPEPRLSKGLQRFLKEGATVSQRSGIVILLVTDTALQTAVRMRNLELIEVLLSAGASLDGHECGDSPLQIAIKLNDDALADTLLNHGAKIDAPAKWPFGRTAVQAASENGNIGLLRLLLSDVSDTWRIQRINAPPSRVGGRTSLQAAAENGHVEVLQFLLGLGANVNSLPAERFGVTTLQAAALSGSLIIANIVLMAGADTGTPPGTVSALNGAVGQNNLPMFEIMLQRGVDVNSAPVKDGRSPLQVAAMQESIQFLRELLHAGADVNAWWTESSESTALYTAVAHGRFEATQLLLQAGASPNLAGWADKSRIDIDGSNALGVAISEDFNMDMIQLLIDYGANVNSRICLADRYVNRYRSILGHAAKNRLQEVVRLLLASGADVNWRFSLDDEPALVSAISGGNDEIVHMVPDASADITAPSPGSGCTNPLQVATWLGNPDHVRALLARGADVNAPPSREHYETAYKATPLQGAMNSGNQEVVHRILDAGAEINAPASPDGGRTALQQAAERGNIDHIQLLLQKGADVNAPPSEEGGVTALQAASIQGHLAVAIYLLDAGADINAPASDYEGRTALQGAAEHGRLDIVALLLENDDEIEDFYDRCEEAAEFAERERHMVIARMLRGYRKD